MDAAVRAEGGGVPYSPVDDRVAVAVRKVVVPPARSRAERVKCDVRGSEDEVDAT